MRVAKAIETPEKAKTFLREVGPWIWDTARGLDLVLLVEWVRRELGPPGS